MMGSLGYVKLKAFSCFQRIVRGIKVHEVDTPFILNFSCQRYQVVLLISPDLFCKWENIVKITFSCTRVVDQLTSKPLLCSPIILRHWINLDIGSVESREHFRSIAHHHYSTWLRLPNRISIFLCCALSLEEIYQSVVNFLPIID